MQAWVWRRGWRSHRHATFLVSGRSSSRPKTVVWMPAIVKVLEDIEGTEKEE